MPKTRLLTGGLILSLALLNGCATYVNIPAQVGDIANNDPNHRTVRAVELVALQAVIAEHPMLTPFELVLPAGTLPRHYEQMVPEVSIHATWAGQNPDADLPVLEVRQVRIRNDAAQVDIVRPSNPMDFAAPPQLLTVALDWDVLAGWGPKRVRLWHGSVEEALDRSHAP